jgi:prolyl-tRNA synthetase
MFADMELIGIPHRLVLSESGLDEGLIEYKNRTGTVDKKLSLENIEQELREAVKP